MGYNIAFVLLISFLLIELSFAQGWWRDLDVDDKSIRERAVKTAMDAITNSGYKREKEYQGFVNNHENAKLVGYKERDNNGHDEYIVYEYKINPDIEIWEEDNDIIECFIAARDLKVSVLRIAAHSIPKGERCEKLRVCEITYSRLSQECQKYVDKRNQDL